MFLGYNRTKQGTYVSCHSPAKPPQLAFTTQVWDCLWPNAFNKLSLSPIAWSKLKYFPRQSVTRWGQTLSLA